MTRRVVDGSPRQALLEDAHERETDLVVIGRDGTGLGSVASDLAHELGVPLVLVGSTDRAGEERPIVVGDDGSEAATAAVRVAEELGSALGSPVVAVLAEADDGGSGGGAAGPIGSAPTATRGDTIVVDRPAAAGLEATAEATDASCLVVGTDSHGLVADLRLGPVTSRLSDDASVPLVIVTHDR